MKERIKNYIKAGIMITYILLTMLFITGLMGNDSAASKDDVGGMLGSWFIFTLPILFFNSWCAERKRRKK